MPKHYLTEKGRSAPIVVASVAGFVANITGGLFPILDFRRRSKALLPLSCGSLSSSLQCAPFTCQFNIFGTVALLRGSKPKRTT